MQGKQKAETQQRCRLHAACRMLRRRRLRLFAFKFFTLNSFEACQQKSKQSYKRRGAPQGRGRRRGEWGRGEAWLWLGLNAAQNEANTYVATVGRPAATKMTGGLDSFQLQKLPFVVCALPAFFPV